MDDIFPLLFVIGSIFITFIAYGFYFSHRRSIKKKQWPRTQAKVLKNESTYTWETVSYSDHSQDNATRRSTRTGTVYRIHLLYEYQVNGQTYKGNHLKNALAFSRIAFRKLKKEAAKYPQGSQVNVYYNPEDPSISLLNPEYGSNMIISFVMLILLPLVFVFVGLIMLA